jgi:hypothetical protein
VGGSSGDAMVRIIKMCSFEQIAELRIGHFGATGTHIKDTRRGWLPG